MRWRSARAGAGACGRWGLRGIGPALAGNVGAGWAFALSRDGNQDVDVPMLAPARSRCRFVEAQEGSGPIPLPLSLALALGIRGAGFLGLCGTGVS